MKNRLFSKIQSAETYLDSSDKTLYVHYEVGSFVSSKEEEEDKFYTHYFAEIFLEDTNPSSDSKEQIGTMSFTRLSFAHFVSSEIFWIFDSNDLFSRLYERIYDEENHEWLIEEIDSANNFWLMDDVVIKQEYRGKGLVQLLMLDKMKKFFSHNDLIFSFSFPLQFDMKFIGESEHEFWKTDNKITFTQAQKKLKKSYKDVGYQYLEDYKMDISDSTKLIDRIKNESTEDNKLIYFIYEG